jgi:hypothetical protein
LKIRKCLTILKACSRKFDVTSKHEGKKKKDSPLLS